MPVQWIDSTIAFNWREIVTNADYEPVKAFMTVKVVETVAIAEIVKTVQAIDAVESAEIAKVFEVDELSKAM